MGKEDESCEVEVLAELDGRARGSGKERRRVENRDRPVERTRREEPEVRGSERETKTKKI